MASVDLSVLIALLLFMILGFRDGFFKKFFSIVGFLVGMMAATFYMDVVGERYTKWIDFSDEICYLLAFLTILLGTILVVNLIYRWFGQSAKESLSIGSRFAGGFLGILQGLVAVSLVFLALTLFDEPSEGARSASVLYRPLTRLAPAVYDHSTKWIPGYKPFIDAMHSKIERFHKPR